MQIGFLCSICKHGGTFSAQAAVHGHPAVVAFCYEHGIERVFDVEDPVACGRFWEHLYEREYTLESTDPERLRVSVPADGETLQVTLDGDLDVIAVERQSV